MLSLKELLTQIEWKDDAPLNTFETIEESPTQIEIELDEKPCFIRLEKLRPWPNTETKIDAVEGTKLGFIDDTKDGRTKTLTLGMELWMSTVTKTIELVADDVDSLLKTDESDTQTERAAMVPSSISAGDRDEVEKSRPNAVI